MRLWPCVVVLLIAVPAMGTTGDVLVVSTDDAELSQALVRAASQQFGGPVAQAPLDWSNPVKAGTLRLQVQAQSGAWHVVLAGPQASVARDLKVTSPVRLDVAEAIALALPGLESRLDAKTQEALEAARERDRERARQRALAETPPKPAPPPAPEPVPPPVVAPPPPVEPVAPPVRPLPAPETVEPPRQVPQPPPAPPPSTGGVGLSFGVSGLSAAHLLSIGGEVSSQVKIAGPWLARLTFAAYGAHFHGDPIWVMPIDVVAGVRATGGPVHFDFALGGELNVVNVPAESGLVTAFVAQATASVHVSPNWSIGLRAAGAFTTDTGDSSAAEPNVLYIPQAQFRLTLLAMWESHD